MMGALVSAHQYFKLPPKSSYPYSIYFIILQSRSFPYDIFIHPQFWLIRHLGSRLLIPTPIFL